MSEPAPPPVSRRNWVGFWSMIVQQTQNAFNDKVAQFILIPLAGALAWGLKVPGGGKIEAEFLAAILIALPFVLFAPLAGWVSDRYSKRDVMFAMAVLQLGVLAWISWSVWQRQLGMAMAGFFALAVQSAFFSPAKFGITKELVGSSHLGFGASLQQMTAMLAILAGQILAGWWFDIRHKAAGSVPSEAWPAALLPLLILTGCAVPTLVLALAIPRVPAQGGPSLTPATLVGHFIALGDLWRRRGLRRASFGVAFFWGFAAYINLWSIQVARLLTGGKEGFGSLSSGFMAAASLGMAAGFGAASWLLRRRIELGWVPLAGGGMAAAALALAFIAPGGWWFPGMLALLSFCAALFLAPLNAWMQDNYPPDRRGELQSSVNLQDCLSGIIATVVLMALPSVLGLWGVPSWLVLRIEIGLAAVLSALMSWFIIRLLPGDFLRVLSLSLLRLFYRITPLYRHRLPQAGGVLLLPNHVTWADSFFIAAAVGRPVRFVMDEAFMARPAVRRFVSLFDTVTIRRDHPREAIRIVLEGLARGDLMCLFPEGQLTRTGNLCPLQRGCELIAHKSGHPVVPLWTDGTWGSFFSFERGRFFRKRPYRWIRYDIRAAFGEPLDPRTLSLPGLRQALGKAAAEAQQSRFRARSWGHRVPRDDAARWNPLPPDTRHRLWRNGYQIAQINALRRKRPFHLLAADGVAGAIPPAVHAFATLFKASAVQSEACVGHGGSWVGGHALRMFLENAPPDGPLTFYDFSDRALKPLELPGITHCPCFALNGLVIAMSMPDPPTRAGQDPQVGGKPGTYGMLLPGWFAAGRGDGTVVLHGPAAPPGGLQLPAGMVVDPDGFLCS